MLCPKLLRDAVAAKPQRIQLLAIRIAPQRGCPGRTGGGSDAPLLATFEAARVKMPVIVPKEDVPRLLQHWRSTTSHGTRAVRFCRVC